MNGDDRVGRGRRKQVPLGKALLLLTPRGLFEKKNRKRNQLVVVACGAFRAKPPSFPSTFADGNRMLTSRGVPLDSIRVQNGSHAAVANILRWKRHRMRANKWHCSERKMIPRLRSPAYLRERERELSL